MANIKHFADLGGETLTFSRVDYRADGAYGYDAGRGWLKVNRSVEYKPNPSKHVCNDKCIHATGKIMKCECSCGGKNHGRGH